MLLPEPHENLRTGGCGVADELDPAAHFQLGDEFRGEGIEGGERFLQRASHEFPMTGRGVLARGLFRETRPRGGGVDRCVVREAKDFGKSQACEIRQGKSRNPLEQVAERVGSGIAVGTGIRRVTTTHGVQHDAQGAFHGSLLTTGEGRVTCSD